MDSTEVLVSRARAGDRGAFDDIVERFRSRLENQIESRMGSQVRARMEAEDILNETFACAFESIDRFAWRGEETFYRWLASIAEHLIRNAARKRGWSSLRIERDVAAGVGFVTFDLWVDGVSVEIAKYAEALRLLLGDPKIHYIAGHFEETCDVVGRGGQEATSANR